MSKKITNKRVVELIDECTQAAADLELSGTAAAGEGRFVQREFDGVRARKFADTASALVELLAFRNAAQRTAK